MHLTVIPYEPSWRNKFKNEAQTIKSALAEVVVEVHHIGSTSIPDIYAKPIIDIMIEVSSLDIIDEEAHHLERIGYEAMGEFGIAGRRYFRKSDSKGVRQFQIHVFVARSQGALRHLAFRDYLLAHPDRAQKYSSLKRKLAEQYSADIEAYIDGKDPFIKSTESLAMDWQRN